MFPSIANTRLYSRASSLAALAVVAACTDPLEPRDRPPPDDALMLRGGTGRDVVIPAGLTSFLDGDPSFSSGAVARISAHLYMEPGASLRILYYTWVTAGGRITAEGTADRPVILAARHIDFSGEPAAPSRIVHARLDSITLSAREKHALVVEDVVGRASGVTLEAPGSKVLRSRFDGGGPSPFCPACFSTIVVRAPDVLLSDVAVRGGRGHGFQLEAPNARLTRCEASGNSGDGVRLTHASGVQITACNIFDNTGFGVNNTAADRVDARGNWWGAPGGPFVPGADEVSANVEYEPYRDRPAEVSNPGHRTAVQMPW